MYKRQVKNTDDKEMHFPIGAHPAFYWPEFDENSLERGFFGFDRKDGKIASFCEEEGIRLVCYLAPGFVRFNEEQLFRMRTELSLLGVPLVDYNEQFDALGMDPSKDYYDTSHIDVYKRQITKSGAMPG